MKKKIWTVLFTLVLCLCVTVPAFAEGAAGFAGDKDRVVDDANLLSDSEETVSYTHLTLPTTPYV